jgi:hypothetical protein
MSRAEDVDANHVVLGTRRTLGKLAALVAAAEIPMPSAANPKFASPWGDAQGEFRIHKLR